MKYEDMKHEPRTARRGSRRYRLRTALHVFMFHVSILVAAHAVSATAGPATQPSPPINQWFTQLADADGAVREQARINLMGLPRDALPALHAIAQKARPLAAAQAAVLRDIVIHVYLAGEAYPGDKATGFLGVTFSHDITDFDRTGAVGVTFAERIPGF